jgi:uncharacterized protein YrrD
MDERSMKMITKIQLQKDATVFTEDGKKIGTLERVVVNPDVNAVTDLVVRTGGMLNHAEKIVPMELIVGTADDKVLLHEDAGDLETFPSFEEEHIVNEHGKNDTSIPFSGSPPPVVTGFPVMGAPMAQAPSKQIVTRLEQNIPEGMVAMKKEAAVLAVDGRQVGKVESVIAEPIMGQITYFVVSSGLFSWTSKLIPIKWVRNIDEEAIRLRVDKSAISNLVEEPIVG